MNEELRKIEAEHDIIDDMIWMSYRYCIGRKSIASQMHAPNLTVFINKNKHLISRERRVRAGWDILSEINDKLRFYPDLQIHGQHKDIMTILLLSRMDKDCKTIIHEHGDVTYEKMEQTAPYSWRDEIPDLMNWYVFAKWLLGGLTITIDGKDYEGFSFVDKNGEIKYQTIEQHVKHPYNISWIPSDKIEQVMRNVYIS